MISRRFEIPKWLKPLLWKHYRVPKIRAQCWIQLQPIMEHVDRWGTTADWQVWVLEMYQQPPEYLATVAQFCERLGLYWQTKTGEERPYRVEIERSGRIPTKN